MDYLETHGFISKHGWKARFDYTPEFQCKPFNFPRLSQILDVVPLSLRYMFRFYLRKRYVERRLPFIDPTKHIPWLPIYGVPMGGIGCGALGRGFRGEFTRSSLIPGMYCYEPQPADHFILTLRKDGVFLHQQVLTPRSGRSTFGSANGMGSWNWGFPAKHAHYVGLYPRSWTVYELPQYNLILLCEQISPVFPNDYQSTCLPACVFVWRAFNFGSDPLEVSITFTWRGPHPHARNNDRSSTSDLASNLNWSRPGQAPYSNFETDTLASESYSHTPETVSAVPRSVTVDVEETGIHGCLLERLIGKELGCCFGIAAKKTESVKVAQCPGFLLRNTKTSVNRKASHLDTLSDGNTIEGTNLRPIKDAPSSEVFWKQLRDPQDHPPHDCTGYAVTSAIDHKKADRKLAVAVTSTCLVPAARHTGSSETQTTVYPSQIEMEFAIVWHSPLVRFRANNIIYRRRYTRWFPEPSFEGARRLLEHTFANWRQWVHRIEDWQFPILDDPKLPDWYKSALFNELYYMTDGGTVWLDPVQAKGQPVDFSLYCTPLDVVRLTHRGTISVDPHELTGREQIKQVGETSSSAMNGQPNLTNAHDYKLKSLAYRCELAKEMGLFGYLEGHEYRMFNTIDVHHYASWALIKLWPKLQLALNYDCADLTIAEDSTLAYFAHQGQLLMRSTPLAVPHDFGDPEDEPWRNTNAYIMYATDHWKDLAPKFVLQSWRDWKLTQDYQYLLYMLPIVWTVIRNCLSSWDGDNDGLIENSGYPDQTYDTWAVRGLSAYTGGHWLSSLYATHDMLQSALSADSPIQSSLEYTTDDRGIEWIEVEKELFDLLQKAKNSYDQKLWTGSHFAYQETRSANHESIMSAQLCGHWFLRVAGAPKDAILPHDHVITALKTIQKTNWESIMNGSMGAINGALPGSRLDLSSCQAEEFWVGVNYALAATMIMENMPDVGMALAGSCYNTVYNRFGLQFQTPEAYMIDGRFRCPGYMRPLAIWSMQHALESKRSDSSSGQF